MAGKQLAAIEHEVFRIDSRRPAPTSFRGAIRGELLRHQSAAVWS
jgi:hypothetical protein